MNSSNKKISAKPPYLIFSAVKNHVREANILSFLQHIPPTPVFFQIPFLSAKAQLSQNSKAFRKNYTGGLLL